MRPRGSIASGVRGVISVSESFRGFDRPARAKWLELAPLIDRMMKRSDTEGEFSVSSDSALGGDDTAADPYHVSHVVRQCLTAGVDHLHAVKELVVERGVIHIAAPASLARGAIENFATALWVIGPTRRDDRIQRALRWHVKNVRDQEKAAAPLGLPNYTGAADKLTMLDAVCARRGLSVRDVRRGYTSTEVVRYSEEIAGDLPLGVVLPWQICSGFAHGRPWAYLGVSAREEAPTDNPDVLSVRLTSDHSRALYPTLAAVQLLEVFLRIYEQRSHRRGG